MEFDDLLMIGCVAQQMGGGRFDWLPDLRSEGVWLMCGGMSGVAHYKKCSLKQ